MRHGSLFSGIGGFDLAAEWMGWENVFQVEIDDYCQKVLAKNFPNVKRYGDIKTFKGRPNSVDILTGGFPCQPFSHAGKRKGKSDDRYLWPEYLRIIREIKPAYVVGENVAGLISMEDGRVLDGILLDMESEGYQTEQFIIPACGLGAWHRRARIWIVGYLPDRINSDPSCTNPHSTGSHREEVNDHREVKLQDKQECKPKQMGEDVPHPPKSGLQDGRGSQVGERQGKKPQPERQGSPHGELQDVPHPTDTRIKRMHQWENLSSGRQWETEPNVGRVANGIPKRVDRLKGLGNAIVPQVAYEIFKAVETTV